MKLILRGLQLGSDPAFALVEEGTGGEVPGATPTEVGTKATGSNPRPHNRSLKPYG